MAPKYPRRNAQPFTETRWCEVAYSALGVPTLIEGQPEVEGATSAGVGQLLISFSRGGYRLEKLSVTVVSADVGAPIPKAFPLAVGGSGALVDAELQSMSPTLMIGFENWTGVLTNPTSVTLRIEITVKTSSI